MIGLFCPDDCVCPPPCTGSAEFTYLGCNDLPIVGMTVTLKDAGNNTVGTEVTDANGIVTFTGLEASVGGVSYTATATRSRWVTSSLQAGVTVYCDDTSEIEVHPTADTGFTCQWSTCSEPTPKTVYATTAIGTATLVAQFTGGTLTHYAATADLSFSYDCYGTKTGYLTLSLTRDSGTGEIFLNVSASGKRSQNLGSCAEPSYEVCFHNGGAPGAGWTVIQLAEQLSLGFDWCSDIALEVEATEGCYLFGETCFGGGIPVFIETNICLAWPITTVTIDE